ncbi:hypothetical protein E0Z10_g10339 [Xylaria hypoxylon]|uniref:DUF7580 domain-containing protein n=1 Tax=Xylaria hypoxylon TaxID=37992 RepID=A0A4Z0Y388_9PEZI|nr:hypothetical protein E0Z10_g10339 [Xylaria hypoxylon]
MAMPNQQQYQHRYPQTSEQNNQPLYQQMNNPNLQPQNGGSISSNGNVAQPYSIQLVGGLHDSGTRDYSNTGTKIAAHDYRQNTRVVGHVLNFNIQAPGHVASGATDAPHDEHIGDDGPIGILHKVKSLNAPASDPPEGFGLTWPVQGLGEEAWQQPASLVRNPAFRSLEMGVADTNGASADASSGGFVGTRLKRIIQIELRTISTHHKSIVRMVEGHKEFIPEKKKILLDEMGCWDDTKSSSLVEEMSQLLRNLAKTLRTAGQHLDKFGASLKKVIVDISPRSTRRPVKRLALKNIKSQLDAFCSDLRIITDHISRFQDLCAVFSEITRSMLLSEEDGDETDKEVDEVYVALDNLRTSRHASASLYQQLGQVCPQHYEHQFYFHLQLDEPEDLGIQSIKFRLSVERNNIDDNGPKRIWFCARASLREDEAECDSPSSYPTTSSRPSLSVAAPTRPSLLARNFKGDYGTSQPCSVLGDRYGRPRTPRQSSTSRQATTGRVRKLTNFFSRGRDGDPRSRHGRSFRPEYAIPELAKEKPRPRPLPTGTSCLESLSQGKDRFAADLPRLEDRGGVSCQLWFPLSFPDSTPITLLAWIRKMRHCSSDPTHPSSTKLQLMCIRVAKQIVRSVLGLSPNLWPQQRPLQAKDILILNHEKGALEPLLDVHCTKKGVSNTTEAIGMPTHPAIILRIAIILLELAYLEEMPQLRETESGNVNRNHENFHEVRKKCDLKQSFGGDAYARAVKHCFEFNGSAEEFFSSERHQRRFYREVVLGLERAEKSILKTITLQEGY